MHSIYIHGVSSLGSSAASLIWMMSAPWFDTECLVQSLTSGVVLFLGLLAMQPFKVARVGIVFPFSEHSPWSLGGVGVQSNYC